MLNNDILRRLRYALSLNDKDMLAIFKRMDNEITVEYLHSIIAKEDAANYIQCRDVQLCVFLDGLILEKRGAQEGKEPTPQRRLNNNEILQKIRIALSLRSDDVVDVLKKANFRMSKGEVGAFFRKPDHRNYKECGDQVLRNFLNGLTAKNRV